VIAYLDCVGGLAGDMLLSALLDAGGPEEELRAVPARLGLEDVELRIERVERHGIGALHLDVLAPKQPAHRHWSEIRGRLEAAGLAERVRAEAQRVFERLAEAEAGIHGVPVEDVRFHELGAVDTLVDVVGAVTLFAALGVERLVCSPLPQGHGTIQTAHGAIPLPAPATAALLVGAPVFGVDLEGELVTPTGAALAATLAHAWGPLPAMTPSAVGYGAGTRDWPTRANIVRVLLGHGAAAAREVVVLEANLDDLLPELVPDAMEACFAAGALDVWTTPAGMKKGRPGLVLAALAPPEAEAAVARALLRETSTLGVRVSGRHRWELEREERQVEVQGRPVRVKVGRLDGEVLNVAPEHDDCAAVARATGASVKSVWAAALAAALEA
jgi:pyridinium-3,5-bisthiocarboxylic acid mononucleotide nickel chelatase